uniref:Uncharacterized protein n=1 Tax=viral metagenome TaxID=1070528 RepID=A0A6C0KQ88_9ZZZZ
MSNALILRTVYALNSNTGQFLSTGQILLTDGLGGTFWTDVFSSFIVYGGPIMNNLPSTINNFSTQIYFNNAYFGGLSSISTDMYFAISSLSTAISLTVQSNIGNLNGVSQTQLTAQLTSTTTGLGGLGWVSTSGVYGIVSTINSVGQVTPSTLSTIATSLQTDYGIYGLSSINTFNNSSFGGLGSIGYISSKTLSSVVQGLGSIGYISSQTLSSVIQSLGSIGYISSQTLSTVIQNLGSLGYVSSTGLTSTVTGLGTAGYVSIATLCNAINQGFSTMITMSTIVGLGTLGYVSTATLMSSIQAISIMKTSIRFDTTTSVTTINGNNYFGNVGQIIYISTFLKSSINYFGNTGTQITGKYISPYDMTFSTATIDFTPFSPYINSNSAITLDIFPTIAFTKLATGATNVAIIPISTFLQQGLTQYYNTTTTSFLYAGNTRVQLENGTLIDSSNVYNTPITLQVPPGTMSTFSQPFNVVHYMPSSINQAGFQNALHSNTLTPYFANTGSLFVSVQNYA